MSSFLDELKKRRVYRVAIGYAIVAWLVVQIASTVLPTFHAPEWVVQALIVVVALGFPIALVMAWAFEVTPSGIEKTAGGSGVVAARNTRNGWLLAAFGIASAELFVGGYWLGHSGRVGTDRRAVQSTALNHTGGRASGASLPNEKSIAVLPFENLSRDPDNAYFVDGNAGS